MFDGGTLLAWIGGLFVLSICWGLACLFESERIDESHPDALGSLDVRERVS
jgi:hypothetical protein